MRANNQTANNEMQILDIDRLSIFDKQNARRLSLEQRQVTKKNNKASLKTKIYKLTSFFSTTSFPFSSKYLDK